MIMIVPSVIIIMPSVAVTETEDYRRVPAAVVERIITPVIVGSVIRIISVITAISVVIYRVI
jgi:hypothetical protein